MTMGVYENKLRRDKRLPNKSIKVQAENRAGRLKIVCLLKLKSRMEEIKRLKRREAGENVGESVCKQETKTGLFESKGKAI